MNMVRAVGVSTAEMIHPALATDFSKMDIYDCLFQALSTEMSLTWPYSNYKRIIA